MSWIVFRLHFQSYTYFVFLRIVYNIGPDRLELIIFDITGKKIDNHPSRLIIVKLASF